MIVVLASQRNENKTPRANQPIEFRISARHVNPITQQFVPKRALKLKLTKTVINLAAS